jgi:hypothetical protein
VTPGVGIIGSSALERDRSTHRDDSDTRLMRVVRDYVLIKGGRKTSELRIDTLSTKITESNVKAIQLARIKGLHKKWGLDRKWVSEPMIYAHNMEKGAIFEHSVISHNGYVRRTYYIVVGRAFQPFAKWNFKKRKY